MAMGKKKDIGDIIRDAMRGGKPKPSVTGKPQYRSGKPAAMDEDLRNVPYNLRVFDQERPKPKKRRSIRERQKLAAQVGSKAEKNRNYRLKEKYGK